jgi:hypothetical protein
MPFASIDIPSCLMSKSKTQLVKEVAESLHDAYPIPDTPARVDRRADEHRRRPCRAVSTRL